MKAQKLIMFSNAERERESDSHTERMKEANIYCKSIDKNKINNKKFLNNEKDCAGNVTVNDRK